MNDNLIILLFIIHTLFYASISSIVTNPLSFVTTTTVSPFFTIEPLLGKLVIPENDPKKARVERTEMGNALVDKLLSHPSYYPEVRILQFCLMPDHLHAILHVTRPMNTSIRTVVRSFWQGAKKLGKAYTKSIDPEFDSGTINKDIDIPDSVFTERPFVRPLSR